MDVIEKLVAGHRSVLERKEFMDKLSAVLKNEPDFWEHASAVETFFKNELREHFRLEEKVLFPVLEKAVSPKEKPILQQILAEHAPILQKIAASERIFAEYSARHTQELKESLLASYIHIMEAALPHAKKEDELLFPLIKQYFTAEHNKELEKLYFEYLQSS